MDTKWIMQFDELSNSIIKYALKVHTALGPGLFEEVYKACLKYELTKAGIKVFTEVGLPVIYDGVELDVGYRTDLSVEDKLIVELKSVELLRSVHRSQVLTYLKLAKKEVGLLLNFNTPHLKQRIIRIVNSYPTSCPSRPSRYNPFSR